MAQHGSTEGYAVVGPMYHPGGVQIIDESSLATPRTETLDALHMVAWQQSALLQAVTATTSAMESGPKRKDGDRSHDDELSGTRSTTVTSDSNNNLQPMAMPSDSLLVGSETECDEQSGALSPLQAVQSAGGIVDLSNRRLTSGNLLPEITRLCTERLKRIDLSNTGLVGLPDEIGYLRQLQSMDLSGNRLEVLPATIAFWQHLQTMDVSNNRLTDLPSAMRHLGRLEVLDLASNRFASIPKCLWKLPELRSLNVSHNPITILPARMFIHDGVAAPSRDKLKLFLLEGCPLLKETPDNADITQNSALRFDSDGFRCSAMVSGGRDVDGMSHQTILSLVDTLLYRMIENNYEYPSGLPQHLQQRLDSFVPCDYCHRLYPAALGTKRQSFVYRNKIRLPVEYGLCRAHWDDEKSRIASMFAPRVPEKAQGYYKPKQAALALTICV
ncbi:hypothetical protein H4217_005435 [Coemansia sp. RSA 1939]|nr:hypothetical protein H4217_005435 [Coemansia sp. RSA 1939]